MKEVLTQCVIQDEQAVVRSSAVVAVAECVSALGPRSLPQMGFIVDTVLGAAEASLVHIAVDVPAAADAKQVSYLACHLFFLRSSSALTHSGKSAWYALVVCILHYDSSNTGPRLP